MVWEVWDNQKSDSEIIISPKEMKDWYNEFGTTWLPKLLHVTFLRWDTEIWLQIQYVLDTHRELR